MKGIVAPASVNVIALLMLALGLVSPASATWKEQVLYTFQGGSDGQTPAGGVVFDKQGNLYGATQTGIVFQLAPPAKKGDPWTETLLYTFLGKGNNNDGLQPSGGLIIDAAGNLYGVTAYGGTGGCILDGIPYGCGTVYGLSPPKQKGGQWTETILYSFQSGNDGYFPTGDLTFDKAGNLYGATAFGGGKGNTCDPFYGGNCGTVFKLTPPKQKGGAWTEKVLHDFAGIATGKQVGDGANPNGGLVLDSKGVVYGTSYEGGAGGGECGTVGCGTVFELKPSAKKREAWAETVLHRFRPKNSVDELPEAGLTMDRKGSLYGTTHGDTVFRLTPSSKRPGSWNETLLYAFNGKGNSYALNAPLTFDAGGNLYSTAYVGTGKSVNGNVFRLTRPAGKGRAWIFDVLYAFAGSPDGALPASGLIFDTQGNLYSTTQVGGTGQGCQGGCGTVFEVSP